MAALPSSRSEARRSILAGWSVGARPGCSVDVCPGCSVDIRPGCSVEVSRGCFGAMMSVSLINDGPVTILLDSERLF